ncbi:MAG: 50S ribosomal protein L21e [Candidatus Aenigmarchaeota archaeon]|nr:50S ribosomal protein L21e [Candidatus Aenigmarchaeota archaeon]
MVVKSHGLRKSTRSKYKKKTKTTITKYLQKFEVNQKVAIVTDSSSNSGMPFRRFHGLTGKVIGKRGRAYIIELKDSGKLKKIIVSPEHLKMV